MIMQSQYDFDLLCPRTYVLVLAGMMFCDVSLQQAKLGERHSSDLDAGAEVGHIDIFRSTGIEDQPNLLVYVVLCKWQ